jgi:hypothetical protein
VGLIFSNPLCLDPFSGNGGSRFGTKADAAYWRELKLPARPGVRRHRTRASVRRSTSARPRDDAIRSLARSNHVEAIYLEEQLCEKGRCPTVRGNLPLYSDIEHLSPGGAIVLLKAPLRALPLHSTSR